MATLSLFGAPVGAAGLIEDLCVVVTTLAVGWGAPGWLLLGGLFLLLGLLVPPVVRWAARTRPVEVVAAPIPVG